MKRMNQNKTHRTYVSAYVLLFIIHCSLFIFMTACSKTTSTKIGSLTGVISLNNDTGNAALDPDDYANVKVLLYNKAELDPDITTINNNHPNIGVIINQETEFDHRLQTPVKSVLTDADGSFTMTKIDPGSYNLVIMKEGWGVRYLYDLDIVEGENTLGTAPKSVSGNREAVELYPALQIEGYMSTEYVFMTNHSYIITEDAIFTAGATYEPGGYIWINPTKKVSHYSWVSLPLVNSSFARITSADDMYTTTQLYETDIRPFYSVECTPSVSFVQNRLSSVVITNSQFGLEIKTSNAIMSNMVFRYNNISIQIFGISGFSLSKCLVTYSGSADEGAISYINCDSVSTLNSVIMHCPIGISQRACTNALVNNSYFKDNRSEDSVTDIDYILPENTDVYNLFQTTGTVSHCTFVNSEKAIYTAGYCNTTIEYCNIQGRYGIINKNQLNYNSSYFTAHYNNLDCSEIAALTRAVFWHEVHLDAANNYWGTTSSDAIANLIWDAVEDNDDPDFSICGAFIDYIPFRYSAVSNAGVQ